MEKLKIRKDRTPAMLCELAKAESDVRVARRLLAIANALCGMSRAAAGESAGLDRQTLRDWVIRYNEHGVVGLCDRWKGGRPSLLTADEQVCIGVGDRPLHTPLSTRPHSRAQLTCVRLQPPQIQASVTDELSIEGGQIWTPIGGQDCTPFDIHRAPSSRS